MKAIVLAAGRGSRMGSLTEDSPKCMVELAGKPLLHWQLEALKHPQIEKVGIIKGYLKESLSLTGIEEFVNEKWHETNMVMTLMEAEPWLQADTCIVSYSDIVYPPDTVERLIEAEGDIVITYDRLWLALWEARFENPLFDAESFQVNEQGFLQEIGNKVDDLHVIKGQYMGLLRFTPKGWIAVKKYLESVNKEVLNKMDMTSLLQELLLRGIAIQTVPVDGQWCEVDNEHDLNLYNQLILHQDKRLNSHLGFLKL